MPRPRRVPWRVFRRGAQLGCLILFLGLFRATEYVPLQEIPAAANVAFRLDPLTSLSAILAAREVVVSLWPAAVVLVATLILGRFFCGWVCPLGTLLDLSRRVPRLLVPRRWRRREPVGRGGGGRPEPGDGAEVDGASDRASPRDSSSLVARPTPRWQQVKYILLAVILVSAALRLPLVGLFDPFAILFRGLTLSVDPALSRTVSAPFDWLFHNAPEGVTGVSEPVYGLLKAYLLAGQLGTYLLGGVSLAILIVIFVLEFRERRFWCRNLCPLGALFAWSSRFSILRRVPSLSCGGCGDCLEDCRMGAFDEQGELAAPSCNLCLDCLADCRHGIVKFRFEWPSGRRAFLRPVAFEPTRRGWLAAAGAGVALAATAALGRSASAAIRPGLLRPPGASPDEGEFLALCVRCGECLKVCPTNVLQPAGLEGGWEGLFSPRLVNRIGYCEYNCTLCGELCPTGAIPRLTEEEKHAAVIGKAQFDRNRCLPLARHEDCIVCEEHCPVPDKAIRTREVDVVGPQGETVRIHEPRVDLDLCVGCGICENKCPLEGQAGIRVLAPSDVAYPAGGGYGY